jgi:hypothetical protein
MGFSSVRQQSQTADSDSTLRYMGEWGLGRASSELIILCYFLALSTIANAELSLLTLNYNTSMRTYCQNFNLLRKHTYYNNLMSWRTKPIRGTIISPKPTGRSMTKNSESNNLNCSMKKMGNTDKETLIHIAQLQDRLHGANRQVENLSAEIARLNDLLAK